MAYAELVPVSTVSSDWNATGTPHHEQIAKTGETPSTATYINCGADGKLGHFRFDGTQLPGSPDRISSFRPRLYVEGISTSEIPAVRVEVYVGGGMIGQFVTAMETGSGVWSWISFTISSQELLYAIFSSSNVDVIVYSLDGDAGYPQWEESG